MTATNNEERRPWQPGDGLHCSQKKAAPREIPCGPPVVTIIQRVSFGGSRSGSKRTRVLCANHANDVLLPGDMLTKARKHATERLITEHWDIFHTYVTDAVKAIQVADQNGGDPS